MFSNRFLCYEAWTNQQHRCYQCDSEIHAQEIFEECLVDARLECMECHELRNAPTGGDHDASLEH